MDQSILGKIIQAFDLLIPNSSLYSLRKFQHLGHMSADHKHTDMERENHSSDISIKIWISILPALDMKYGGSSPSAVPMPHKTASSWIWAKMLVSGIREPCSDEYIGGPKEVQFLSSHEGPLCSWIVSYTELFISTRPHFTALIVNRAICGPKYRTNVCRPDPAGHEKFQRFKYFPSKSPEHDIIRKREKNPVLVAKFVA